MERVVYLLGAGFSAPLGLPLMGDFLVKSKDMFAQDPRKYAHFEEVFRVINEMSVSKNYYASDLFNIEEILSLLEIREFVQGKRLRQVFTRYIEDVIAFHTPALTTGGRLPSNWQGLIFGRDPRWRGMGFFVLNLCRLVPRADGTARHGFVASLRPHASVKYDIVSLNYDRVVETVVDFLNEAGVENGPVRLDQADGDWPLLAKLHGGVGGTTIVPPTWSKGTHSEIVPTWNQALNLLSAANHLRVIGYSLPTSDSYVKYLLKAASLSAPHLKHIDVLCLDRTGEVKRRYDELVTFPRFRFVDAPVEQYFEALLNGSVHGFNPRGDDWYAKLETIHAAFFGKDSMKITDSA